MKKSILAFLILCVAVAVYALGDSPIGGGGGGDGNATSIQDDLIVNADVNSAANIDRSKMGDNTIAPPKLKASGTPDNTMYPRYKSATEFEWTAPAGTGDVTGPASSTADAIVLFNGTGGKTIKDSTYTITAAGAALLDDAAASNQRTTLGLDNASNYPTILASKGGTGQDSSASTGFPYVLSGTWSFDNLATMLGRLGLSSTDNVTFNKLTIGSVVPSGADNTHLINVANTADPSGPVSGDCWYDNTTKTWDCYDGSATNLRGAVYTATYADNTTLSASECFGGVIYVSAAKTITLPAIQYGMSLIVYGTGANLVAVDPNASDRIVLDGTAIADGVTITSPATAGSMISLIYDSAAGWTTFGRVGTWTSP